MANRHGRLNIKRRILKRNYYRYWREAATILLVTFILMFLNTISVHFFVKRFKIINSGGIQDREIFIFAKYGDRTNEYSSLVTELIINTNFSKR